jgi:multidrug resistance protein, MATE family
MARGAQTAEQGGLGELLRLAWPTVLARLGIMAMGLTDAIVVGRYSATELGYHALGWAPTATVLTAAVGLLTGVQVMTARYVGEGRPADTGVLRRGLAYAALIGIVSTVALYLAGPAFLAASGIEPDLAAGSTVALKVFTLSLFPYLLCVAATFWLEALGRPMPGMVAMWAANIVNLALNLWLVPGTSGLPVDGAVASAWATCGARIALLLMLFAYIWRWPGSRAHGVFTPGDDGHGAEQRRIGYGAGASYFVEAAAFSGMSFVAGLIGSLEVAAWAVVLNVAAVIFMAPLGLASALATAPACCAPACSASASPPRCLPRSARSSGSARCRSPAPTPPRRRCCGSSCRRCCCPACSSLPTASRSWPRTRCARAATSGCRPSRT